MKKTGLGILCALVLSACGNNNDNNNAGLIQQGLGVNPPQGYCAPNVIDAFNNFANRCSNVNSGMDVQVCRFASEHFMRNYAGISCVAMPVNPYQGPYYGNYQGQQVFHITDAPVRQMLEILGRYGNGNPNWSHGHRRWPRVGPRQ